MQNSLILELALKGQNSSMASSHIYGEKEKETSNCSGYNLSLNSGTFFNLSYRTLRSLGDSMTSRKTFPKKRRFQMSPGNSSEFKISMCSSFTNPSKALFPRSFNALAK